jgi:hypothetical protein
MRKIYNLSLLFMAMMTMFSFTSCNDEVDEAILPMVGIYEAHVVGISGPFSINVSGLRGDDILIDAPFDGDVWSVVEADIDDVDRDKWDINISRQVLAPGIEIWGEGFYYFGTIQLNYSMSFYGDVFDYKLVGEK